MKITLLGFLALVALGALLLYVANQIGEENDKETHSGYLMPDLNPPDTLPGIPGSQ